MTHTEANSSDHSRNTFEIVVDQEQRQRLVGVRTTLESIFLGETRGITPETVEVDNKMYQVGMHIYPARQHGESDFAMGVVKDGEKYIFETHMSGEVMPFDNTHSHGLTCLEYALDRDKITVTPIPVARIALPLDPQKVIPAIERIVDIFAINSPYSDPLNPEHGNKLHDLTRQMRGKDPSRNRLFQHKALQVGLDKKLGLSA